MTTTPDRLASGTDVAMFDLKLNVADGRLEVGLADPRPELTDEASGTNLIAGSPEFHSFHHADQGTHVECTWDVCVEWLEWLGTDQRVCVVCDAPVLASPGAPYGYRHVDYAIDHTAQVKLAHPMDADPFAGLPDTDEPVAKLPVTPCAETATHEPHEWDDTTQLVFPAVRCPGIDEPAFPPAEREPSISLDQFQQRVAAGEWQPTVKPAPVERANPQQTEYGLSVLTALGDPIRGRHVYGGTVTYRTKTNRRARTRMARRSRRINRGR